MITWKWCSFSELDLKKLYKILKLRQDVFVLEQQCFYPDIDNIDDQCWHLLALNSAAELIAYLRVVEPGVKYAHPAIGRVIVRSENRGVGLGKTLVLKGVQHTQQQFSSPIIWVSAQQHLAGFYRDLGFEATGKSYLEDGIPHIEMHWQKTVK